MRGRIILAAVLALAGSASWCAALPSDKEIFAPPPAHVEKEDPNALWHPQADVAKDPPSWYSPALFQKIGKPGPGDWMEAHPEPAQSFQEYVGSDLVRPTRMRHTIFLMPVGQMTPKDRARMAILREFVELYYTLPVEMSPWQALDGVTGRDREIMGNKVRQYLTGDVMQKVLRTHLPRNGYCILGVTMDDLYPEDSWNYVFGQATLSARVGIYSLVRFYPAFWNLKETPEAEALGMRRSLAVMVHETGHMFGVQHCQAYECVMCGCNSLGESDRRPIHLCPECLKKARWNIGFDVVVRYQGLKKFYEAHEMKDEAAWVEKRIQACQSKAK